MEALAAPASGRIRKGAPKSIRLPIFLAATLACGWAHPSAGQLRYPSLPALAMVPDARALGMGGAFTAVAVGPSAVWWNPGALGIPSPWFVQFASRIDETRWYGTDDLDVYAVSGQLHGTGAAFHLVRTGSESHTTAVPHSSDCLAHLGLGTDLAPHVGLGSPGRVRWGVGAAARYYSISIREDHFDTTLRDRAGAFDFDAGSLLAMRVPLAAGTDRDLFAVRGPSCPYAGLRVGGALRGVLDSKLKLYTDRNGTPVGREVRAGAALEAATAPWKRLGPVLAATFSAEMVGDLESGIGSPARCFGVEARLLDIVSLRYGETRDERTDFKGVSRGIGLHLGLPWRAGISLDWARTSFPWFHSVFRPSNPDGDTSQFSGSIWFLP